MALSVFKTVYLFLALIAIPQVLAGHHNARREYGGRHCPKCKNRQGIDPSSNLGSSSIPCGLEGTPTLGPVSTPSDLPPASATTPTPASSPTPDTSPAPDSSPSPSTPSSSPSPSPSSNTDLSTGTGEDPGQAEFLSSHNAARAKYNAGPLIWDHDLEEYAKSWASNCNFEHSGGPHGENLYASTGTSDAITDSVNDWMGEAKDYDPKNPTYSHFTQVVWKATTKIGCVPYTCDPGTIWKDKSYGPATFVVCEYEVPGNVDGEYADNVEIPSA